ncbi:MAG: hypothetical protein ACHBNF_07835 [Chromatiales bacterium]
MKAADPFYDTNVVLYLLSSDPVKADRADRGRCRGLRFVGRMPEGDPPHGKSFYEISRNKRSRFAGIHIFQGTG